MLDGHTTAALSIARATHTLTHVGHSGNLTTATSTASELHLSHALRVAHAVRNRALHGAHGDALEVRRKLLVGAHATTTLLTRERTRVLTGASTWDTSHHHTGLRREGNATALAGNEALLARSVENGGLHVLELALVWRAKL